MRRQVSVWLSNMCQQFKGTLHSSKVPALSWFGRAAHSDVEAMNKELAEFFGVDHNPEHVSNPALHSLEAAAGNLRLEKQVFGDSSLPHQHSNQAQHQQHGPSFSVQHNVLTTAFYNAMQPSSDAQADPPALEQLQQATVQLQEQVQAMARLVQRATVQQQHPIPLRQHLNGQERAGYLGSEPQTPTPATPPAVDPHRTLSWEEFYHPQQQQQHLPQSVAAAQHGYSKQLQQAAASTTAVFTATEATGGPQQLTHVDSSGKASMVDVLHKDSSKRVATASCIVHLGPTAYELVSSNQIKKGDVLTLAQIAGIQGAKQTANLIPLCHNIFLSKVDVKLQLEEQQSAVVITATAKTLGQTGVEMEALTAVSVAALTVYDMCKAVSKDIVISDIKLDYKAGGKSGTWAREQ